MAWKVEGLADLNNRIMALDTDVATKVGQAADRAGAVVLAKAISAAAPVGPTDEGTVETRHGHKVTHQKIVNHIKVKKTRNESPTKVQTTVTAGGAIQAAFEEFGSIHNAPTRWMSKAVAASQDDAIAKIAATLKKRLDKLEK